MNRVFRAKIVKNTFYARFYAHNFYIFIFLAFSVLRLVWIQCLSFHRINRAKKLKTTHHEY